MSDFLFACSQMAMSLGFYIIFAAVGIAMPLLMIIAEGLWPVILGGPLGFIAIETGWTVTEVGRQPWLIYNVMRTAGAVTPAPGLVIPFIAFTILYIFVAVNVFYLLRRQLFAGLLILPEPEKPPPHPQPEAQHVTS